MFLLKIISYILFIIILCEFVIFLMIKYFQNKISWIISNSDEFPIFNQKKIENFIKKNFNQLLGWNWKPHSQHIEKIFSKRNKIFFGKFGERKNIKSAKNYNFASFGDSFVFCRYVKNNQTWQEILSKSVLSRGLNFGVGNYGLDQAYLKYKNTKVPKTVKNIYIGFVPETLSRCLCSWKHYHEFKNIYAFKPKFLLSKGKLKLVENPIKDINSFDNIDKIIYKLRKKEFFYTEKFIKHKLTFPYTFSVLRNPQYNFKLFYYSALKNLKINNNKIYEFIIENNCKTNDDYYLNKKNRLLIREIMFEFLKLSKKKKHKISFLIFPQKYDLLLEKKNYHNFFSELKKNFNIIDFTEIFEKDDINKIYLSAQYGGHLSSYGNKIVANTLAKN